MAITANLSITKVEQSQSQKEVTINAAFDALDKGIAGRLALTLTGGTRTLTTDEGRNAIIEISGVLASAQTINVPAKNHVYIVFNNTTGAFSLTVKTPSGTGVVVPQGKRFLLYCDATNVVQGGSAISTASELPFAPAGNIAATNVQAAIEELDAEKAALAGNGSQVFSTAAASSGAHAVNRDTGDGRYMQKAGATATGAQIGHTDTPVASREFVPKVYADAIAGGFKPHQSVRVAATGNVDIATGGLLTIDGVSLSANDRVLLWKQTNPAENGVYPASAGAWSRATDADAAAAGEIETGFYVYTREGTANKRTAYVLVTTGTITLGTTALTFSEAALFSEVNLVLDNGYIEGFRLKYVSGTALDIEAGVAYVPSLSDYLKSSATISKTSLSLSADTWYYVYLYSNAGSPDVEIATTVPVAYFGDAMHKTGDNSRRFVGAFRTDGSGNVRPYDYTVAGRRQKISYGGSYITILSGGTATSATSVAFPAGSHPAAVIDEVDIGFSASTSSSTQYFARVGRNAAEVNERFIGYVDNSGASIEQKDFSLQLGGGTSVHYLVANAALALTLYLKGITIRR